MKFHVHIATCVGMFLFASYPVYKLHSVPSLYNIFVVETNYTPVIADIVLLEAAPIWRSAPALSRVHRIATSSPSRSFHASAEFERNGWFHEPIFGLER